MLQVRLSDLPWLLLVWGHWTGPQHCVLTLGRWRAGPSTSLLSRTMGIIHSGDPTVRSQDGIPGNAPKTTASSGRCSPWWGQLQGPARPTVGVLQVCWTAGNRRGLGGSCSHMAFPGEREAPCDYSPSNGCAEQKENTIRSKMEI